MWILGLKGLTLPVAHLHHITSLSAQSTTFKEAHKDFHLSIHNNYELFIPKWFSHQFSLQSRITGKICNSKWYQKFSYNQNNCTAKIAIAHCAY